MCFVRTKQQYSRSPIAHGLVCLTTRLLLFVLLAGTHPAAAQRLVLRSFDEESGLSNMSVNSLAQDRAGFLYAGTENGLYRYDGFRFSRLGEQDGLPMMGDVRSVRAAQDGRIWVVFPDRVYLSGSGGAVSAPLDPATDGEAVHRAAVLGRDLLLVRNHRLLVIHSGPGDVLSVMPFVMNAAVAHDPNRALLAADIDTVIVEHDDVWLGCGAAICRLDKGGVTVFDAAAGLPADHWTALLRGHDGTLWLRSPGRIACLPRSASRFSSIDAPGGAGRFARDSGLLELVEDADGRIVTQGAKGLLVHQNGQWITYGRDQDMSYAAVTTMLVDREGSLWIGNYGRGVARMVGPGLFESWGRAQGLADDLVWGMTRDGAGTFWVASDLAVDAIAERAGLPDTQHQLDHPATKWRYPCRSFALVRSAQGLLWVGCDDGTLIRRDPRTGLSETIAKLAPIRTIKIDPAGSIWIATIRGLARIDRPDDARPSVLSDIVPQMGRVFTMTFDGAGEPWVLTEKALFHCDDRQQWHSVLQTDPEGGYQTRSLTFAADGTLWLGSYTTGITRLHIHNDMIIGRDKEPSGHLVSQEVETMQRDAAGRIWIGTDHGLDVTDGKSWRHLDDQDGLAANDINQGAVFIDDDDTSWFGTFGGLSHLVDTRSLFNEMKLHPMVTGISVGSRILSSAQVQGGLIHLRWSTDPLVITFASLDFKLEKSIRFQYRLRGLDRGWVETAAHEVRYPYVPSGKLVFEVMAVDPLHRLLSDSVCITIKIRAPWWRTWPVYAGGTVLILGVLALLWRLRIGYLLVRQRQLEALVGARTREIEQARLVLLKQATFDALTGLLNRPAVLEGLRLAMEDAVLAGMPLGVALLDLDYFKKVNDVFGHLGGDAVLREVGCRLSESTRDGDLAGRYGGEELLLVLPGLKPDAFERIETLRSAVFEAPVIFEGDPIRVTCSMGVTWMRIGDDVTSMIRRADEALYAAKREGRDQVVFDRLPD